MITTKTAMVQTARSYTIIIHIGTAPVGAVTGLPAAAMPMLIIGTAQAVTITTTAQLTLNKDKYEYTTF